VEINQSDVGIVVAANPVKALKPDVLLIKKKGGKDFIPARLVPLNPIEPSSEKDLWKITNVLDPIQEGVSIKSYLFDEISPISF
jgi:hypothetical protein